MKNLSFGLILASTLAGGLVAVEVPPPVPEVPEVAEDIPWMNRPTAEAQAKLEPAPSTLLSAEDQLLVETLIKSTFSYKLASCLTITDLEERCKKPFANYTWKPIVKGKKLYNWEHMILEKLASFSGKIGKEVIFGELRGDWDETHGNRWHVNLQQNKIIRGGFLTNKTVESIAFGFASEIQFRHPLIQPLESISQWDSTAFKVFEELTKLTDVGQSVRHDLADPIKVSLSLKNTTPLQALQEIALMIPARGNSAADMSVKSVNASVRNNLEILTGEERLLYADLDLSLDKLGKTYLRRFPNTDPTPDKVWTIIEEQAKVILKEAESRPIMVQFFIPEPETPSTKIAKTPVNPPPQENQQNNQQTAEKLAALEAEIQALQNQNRQWILQKKDSPQQPLPGVVPPKTPEPKPPVKSR